MKKLLILILIALILTLTIFTFMNGLNIGGLQILGLKQIQDKNAELEGKVTEATKLASSNFPSKISELNTSMKNLETKKKSYEDMVAVSNSDDVCIQGINAERTQIDYKKTSLFSSPNTISLK